VQSLLGVLYNGSQVGYCQIAAFNVAENCYLREILPIPSLHITAKEKLIINSVGVLDIALGFAIHTIVLWKNI